jgi:GNAT superfamily N-acetyltransferase
MDILSHSEQVWATQHWRTDLELLSAVNAQTANAIERASNFLRRTAELAADSIQEIDGGWVMTTPSLPHVWNLNQVWLTARVSGKKATELADEHLAELPYRQLLAEGALGRDLVSPLRGQGFKVECEVVMTIDRHSDDQPAGAWTRDVPAVIEADEQAMLKVERRWLEEDERVSSSEAIEQLLEAGLREGRAWGERRFGIVSEHGRLAAIAKLRSEGRTAQVEDLYTVPEARKRGFARTLVSHAVRAAQLAGHDLIFIVADDDDWPKHLYASVGFRPAGLRWAFHREFLRSTEGTGQPL